MTMRVVLVVDASGRFTRPILPGETASDGDGNSMAQGSGPQGAPGSPSTVPGPAGQDGAAGAKGDTGAAGSQPFAWQLVIPPLSDSGALFAEQIALTSGL